MSNRTSIQRGGGSLEAQAYDPTQQLKQTVTAGSTVTMTYDNNGNRTSTNGGGYYVSNNLNQYTIFNWGSASYDPKGNLTYYNGFTYTYDAQNRLTLVQQGATIIEQFWYDGLNRQITRNLQGAVSFNVWDGWNLIEERGLGNALQNAYLYGAGEIIENVTTQRFYYQDGLGSTSHLSDAVGNLLERYTYSGFGSPYFYNAAGTMLSASSYGTRHLFQGQLWTQQTGLNDYRNRSELPTMGVFMQPDPIGFKGDAANIYRFCNNNAVNRIDAMGLLSGFSLYKLDYDSHEVLDDTHDGYQVVGVKGSENKPGDAVHLEVDRSVNTVDRIGSRKGGDTRVTTDVSNKDGAATIHQQIDVRYARGAGDRTKTFTQNNEWTHGRDAINSANDLRAYHAGWVKAEHMSASSAVNFIRNGDQRGRINIPSLQRYHDGFMSDQVKKWDNPYGGNGWRTPDGSIVAPHRAIDPYTGNPLDWNQ